MPNKEPTPEDLALFAGCLGALITGFIISLITFGIGTFMYGIIPGLGLASIGLALGLLTGGTIGYKLTRPPRK